MVSGWSVRVFVFKQCEDRVGSHDPRWWHQTETGKRGHRVTGSLGRGRSPGPFTVTPPLSPRASGHEFALHICALVILRMSHACSHSTCDLSKPASRPQAGPGGERLSWCWLLSFLIVEPVVTPRGGGHTWAVPDGRTVGCTPAFRGHSVSFSGIKCSVTGLYDECLFCVFLGN